MLRTVTSTSRSELGTDDDEVRRGGTLEGLCTGRASEEDRDDENEGHNREGPFVPPAVPRDVVGDSRARLIIEVALFSLVLLPLLMLQPPLLLPLAHWWRGWQRMPRQISSSVGSSLRSTTTHYRTPLRFRGVPLDTKACLSWGIFAIRMWCDGSILLLLVAICSLPHASSPPSTHLFRGSSCSIESILAWFRKASVFGAYCVCHPSL